MIKKKLIIIYNTTEANKRIAESDYDNFFALLKDNMNFQNEGILLDVWFCDTGLTVSDKLKLALREDDREFYLHFSGHGQTDGIPYDNWILENADLANMLNDPKIKFCFFASCKSGDLVKVVNERNIPIVIGTQGKNNLSNAFAIKFQNNFYEQLSLKKDFKSAFQTSVSQLRQEDPNVSGDVLVRGGGALVDAANLNDLQLCFNTEDAKKIHLIAPTIIDRIESFSDHAKFLLLYTDDSNNYSEFHKHFIKSGWNEKMTLLLLTDEVLKELNTAKGRMLLSSRSFKVLSVFSDAQKSLPAEYKLLFNTSGIYDQHPSLEFRLATPFQITVKDILSENSHLSQELTPDYLFIYESIEKLFAKDEFIKFLDGQEIQYSDRRKYTLQFECKPTTAEVETIRKNEEYVRVFFARQSNERLINFIINFIRFRKKIKSPNLIFDFRFEENEALYDGFKNRLAQKFPGQANIAPAFLLASVISQKAFTFIFRTHITEQNKLCNEIKKIIQDFQMATQGINEPPAPSYLFFINMDQTKWEEDLQHDIIKTKQFSPPSPITKEIMEAWRDGYKREEEIVFRKVTEIVESIDPEPLLAQCPSEIIALVCDGFEIPRKQILHLS